MGELVFVGLGLFDEKSLTLRGLEELKTAKKVFLELYTSSMPGLSIERLEKLSGKKIFLVSRRELEEENGRFIFAEAEKEKVVLLVPGDPLIATTHITLRIQAEKAGIQTRIVHGASILSAVMGLSGLHNYKFGRSVTIPFPYEGVLSETPYNIIAQNKRLGLHTLCFLDVKAEEKLCMTIREGLEILRRLEDLKKKGIITPKTLVVGIARAGSEKPEVKAGFLENILKHDFGDPPHTLVFPGKLHFMEAEALITLAKAPQAIRSLVE